MKIVYVVSIATLALLMTGCALTTGIRFGDGSVSAPEVHGSVHASGTAR